MSNKRRTDVQDILDTFTAECGGGTAVKRLTAEKNVHIIAETGYHSK